MKRLLSLFIILIVLVGIIVIGLSVGVIITGFSTVQQSSEDKLNIPIRIAYMKIGTSGPFFIAQEKGYFQEEGLDAELILASSGDQGLDGVVAGQMDATINVVPAVLNLEYNVPGKVKAVLMTCSTTSSDTEVQRFIVRADSDIQTLADLKGKKIAVPPSQSNAAVVKLILKRFFNPEELTIIPLSPNEHLSALQSGGVDAAMSIEPSGTVALLKGGFREIAEGFSRANYVVDPFYGGVIVVSSDFMEKYPKGVKRLQRAFARAIEFYNGNEAEARAIIGKYTDCPSEIVQKMHYSHMHLSKNVDKNAFQRLADIYLENGVLKGRVNTADILLEE